MTIKELKKIIDDESDIAGCRNENSSLNLYMQGRCDALCFVLSLLDMVDGENCKIKSGNSDISV